MAVASSQEAPETSDQGCLETYKTSRNTQSFYDLVIPDTTLLLLRMSWPCHLTVCIAPFSPILNPEAQLLVQVMRNAYYFERGECGLGTDY